MSLSFNNDSIVGGPITSGSLEQILLRKKIIEKKSGRNSDDILFLVSNTGWVKLTSSINFKTDEGSDDTPSRENVLTGGIFKNGKLTAGIEFNTSIPNQTDKAYSKSNIHGYRPDAGITSFMVDTKSMFGALRVATVEFRVNSIEQLDTLESLFLRPGFSMLLEWGHSIYVGNDGEIEKTPVTYGDRYFTPADGSQEIINRINTLKQESGYNYDGMFGIVKNFVWSYSLDGGYDCKVDLVSTGELIESLSILIAPEPDNPSILPQGFVGPIPQNSTNPTVSTGQLSKLLFNTNQSRTPLHQFLYTIQLNAGDTSKTPNEIVENVKNSLQKTGFLDNNTNIIVGKFFEHLNKSRYDFKVVSISHLNEETNTGSTFTYIPFQHLLTLLSVIYLPTAGTDGISRITNLYTGDNSSKVKTPFVTFDEHYALDPRKVILPKGNLESTNDKLGYSIASNPIFKSLQETDILNIFVGIDFILKTFDALLDSNEPSKINLLAFLNSILSGINSQLGGINKLDIVHDPSENIHYVIDRKITPGNSANIPVIDVVGTKSMVTNLTFASKLSNNVVNLMAIAAQAQSTDIGIDMLAVQKWNTGLEDRHLKNKFVGTETPASRASKKKTKKEFIKEDDYQRLLDSKIKIQINPTTFNSLQGDLDELLGLDVTHKVVMVGLLNYFTRKEKTNPSGLIPFELSLTLMGISGLKVGQAFRIPDNLIPERYRGNVGFIITGVSHKIQSNRWETDLKTQMFIISQYDEDLD